MFEGNKQNLSNIHRQIVSAIIRDDAYYRISQMENVQEVRDIGTIDSNWNVSTNSFPSGDFAEEEAEIY